ncbi:MAG: hypothetical protein JXB32_02100 [Deltaproteobacteria bacterium]|nr:hypothetical protein [Deltaproteobacteria bacterium]
MRPTRTAWILVLAAAGGCGGDDAHPGDAGSDYAETAGDAGPDAADDGAPTEDDADGGPEADGGELPRLSSVSQFGITWTFSAPMPVGRFANGDYYIVGPATVAAIDPAPGGGRNGSVVNLPAENDRTGFDDRTEAGRYDASLRADPPFELVPGDSLVSTISVDTLPYRGAVDYEILRPEEETTSPVRTAAVLTCVAERQPHDAFRPAYIDDADLVFRAGDLRRELLGRCPPPPSTPALATWERVFERPWIDNLFFGFDAPTDNMADYGREVARAVSIASLLLMVDFPAAEKETLLVRFVQYGIDLWGIVRAGHPGWPAHGGHGSGRKWPILFAGLLLGDAGMQALATDHPATRFGEDMQTMHGTGWTGATALYAGHMGPDGESVNPGWGPYEHLHPRDWLDPIGESYRRCCTSLSWVGEALAARMLGAEALWAHDAFFDYVDRWMSEDDTEHVQVILDSTGRDYRASWARQRQCWDDFVEELWTAHRTGL